MAPYKIQHWSQKRARGFFPILTYQIWIPSYLTLLCACYFFRYQALSQVYSYYSRSDATGLPVPASHEVARGRCQVPVLCSGISKSHTLQRIRWWNANWPPQPISCQVTQQLKMEISGFFFSIFLLFFFKSHLFNLSFIKTVWLSSFSCEESSSDTQHTFRDPPSDLLAIVENIPDGLKERLAVGSFHAAKSSLIQLKEILLLILLLSAHVFIEF